jgi:hypothetical protein
MSHRGDIAMTPAAILAHCEKNKLPIPAELRNGDTLPTKTIERIGAKLLRLGDGKTKPEREMGMILEAQKRRGEIVDYMFQGMSLAYSPDPETGILLRYKCDYVVIVGGGDPKKEMTGLLYDLPPATRIRIIECKGHGKHAISAAAKLRFKGAKAAWPMFKFEMHQRGKDGQWQRVL